MTWLAVMLATLAVYRISTDLAVMAGPAGVYRELRYWLRLPDCPICLSFWLAIPAAWWIGGDWLTWLGIAGGAAFLWRFALVIEVS